MGRTSLTKPKAAATLWLPGFEPEGYECAQLAIQTVDKTPAVVIPPVPVRDVAVCAALVVHDAMSQMTGGLTAPRLIQQPQEVISSADSAWDDDMASAMKVALVEDPAEPAKHWPDFDFKRIVPATGNEARIEANIQAISLLKSLQQEGREPTDDERHQLLRYIGWGGLAKIFEDIPNNTLGAQQQRLKALLTEDEFNSARASTTSAFYTDPVVVMAIWHIIQRLGFKGGRICEPSAGTGMFLAGMPKEIAVKSEITAVELDKVTSDIQSAIFEGLGVQTFSSAIEKASVPHGFFDLVVGNVPFGDHKTLETKKVGYANWLIHNYFFGKSIDLVRPGGLVVLITSTGTLDSVTDAHRKWLSAHAEMLGAIRLPANAFKKQAGTDVVTDVLVFKKREAPVFNDRPDWIGLAQAPESMLLAGQSKTYYSNAMRRYVDYPRDINAWFVRHPGMVIGDLVLETGQYGASKITPKFKGSDEEFQDAIARCVKGMPERVYREQAKETSQWVDEASLTLQRVKATEVTKPGSFVVHDGTIYISEGATWIDVDSAYKGTMRERLLGMIKIRDAARKLVDVQSTSDDESEFKRLQLTLNVIYESFVAKYGNVGDRANTRVFRQDPECPLVLSLEHYDEEEEKFTKAAIFSQRTAGRREPPATAANVKDAMLISLALCGRMNIADMAKRLGQPEREVVVALKQSDLAFIDPQDGRWKPADEYLSGHIRDKIAAAKSAGKSYERNVLALQSVLPKDLGPAEVDVRLGAPWVPVSVVQAFATQLIEAKEADIQVSYDANSATWACKGNSHKTEWIGNRILNTATWGTADRTAVDLIEAALNQSPPKITRKIDGSTFIDRPATLAAREKYEAIKAEFKKWAYADDARRDQLLRIYNDEFNQIVERRYDGSHLVLYGMSNVITPYQHQLDGIWRIVSGNNTLLAHVVGAGKTFTMAASAMELRRIGKAHKPLVAVPNHMLDQFAREMVQFYPNAKVLMASKEDLTGDNRRQFCARVATGDWDLVVMTHATFERMPMRPETTNRFLNSLMGQARMALSAAQDSKAKRTIKQIEKLLKALESKLEKARNDEAKDDFIYFDDLGVDHIMVDEAHLFKNLMRISKMPSIAGLPNVSSNRAFDLWVKTATIMEKRGDVEQGVTFATATPVANSIAELHTMKKFLIPNTLKSMGLYEFDAWAATFGEAVQGMEVAPDGSGYRLNTRFAKFTNVADLMSIFRLAADIRTRSMLNLPTPDLKGGKPQVATSPSSEALKAYTQKLVDRANLIRNGQVKPDEDNMLAVTNCGRKAALDMRLIDPTLPFDPNGKVAKVRDEVLRIWTETAKDRGAQMVFCDLSTPNTTGFSVYQDLKFRLMDAGIPEGEIAFIHDYESDTAKAKLFRMVRAGQVRVLMGSTLKMGVGTNVQKRLKAVHQIDAPWRPADVEQRDGRAWRAGNVFDEIELIRYVTENSFDAYVWQLLETKARFIDQIMSSSTGLRTVEDLAMGALTFAEIKAIASGNPLVLEKATVDAEVLKLTVLQDQWQQDRWSWSNRARGNAKEIEYIEKRMAGLMADAEEVTQAIANGWTFKPRGPLCAAASTTDDVALQIGEQVLELSRSVPKHEVGEWTVGRVGSFRIILARHFDLEVKIDSDSGSYSVDRKGTRITSAAGTGELVLARLRELLDEPQRMAALAQRLQREIKDIETRLASGFEHAEKLNSLLVRQRAIEAELDLDKDQAGTEASEAVDSTAKEDD
jgi:N12 class adenine-specific DNA methylase